MYSKNDYRYYLEHRMVEDNYLAHYGVKGMKWKQHKYEYAPSDYAYDASENAMAIRENMSDPRLDPTGRNTRHNQKQFAKNVSSVVGSSAERMEIRSGRRAYKKKKKKREMRSLTGGRFIPMGVTTAYRHK